MCELFEYVKTAARRNQNKIVEMNETFVYLDSTN
jgi:hypothetical protein